MLSSEQALNELLMRKEEEWRVLQAQRSQLQETALQDAQRQLEEARGKCRRLQEDFVYNLQVLEERDQELERYDAVFARARAQEEARQAEVSELKIEMAKLKQELAREARRVEELQEQLRLRSQEHRLELDRLHSDKNGEIDHQREQYENLKWRLERKLKEVDGELALQRQELLLEFESKMQKREHEFRLQADSMSSTVLAHELKVKLLSKELEALKAAGAQTAECLQRAETANAELEQKLQGCAWELRDLEAVKDARIKDLEDTLHSAQLARKKEEETFNRKHEELDRLARERDAALVAVKGAHVEQLRASEARLQELRAHCESLGGQLRASMEGGRYAFKARRVRCCAGHGWQALWALGSCSRPCPALPLAHWRCEVRWTMAVSSHVEPLISAGQKLVLCSGPLGPASTCGSVGAPRSPAPRGASRSPRLTQFLLLRLRDEAAALKAGWDAQVAQMSREAVSRDLQAQVLRDEEVKLKARLARAQQDVDRYKQQLSQAVERERSLERDQVQLGLDWQRRCDDIERDQIQKSEALIRGLTEARDQVAAKLQETEQALREQEVVLWAVTLERDQATQELQALGPLPGPEPQTPLPQRREVSKDFPSREIQQLQEQNTSLRNAVAQMRREMEMLSEQMPPPAQLTRNTWDGEPPNPHPDPSSAGDTAPPHYVLALETEMQALKHKLQGLEAQREGAQEPPRTGHASPQPGAHCSAEAAGSPAVAAFEAGARLRLGGTGDPVYAGQVSPLVLRKLGDRVHLLTLLVTKLKKKVQQQPLELDTVQRELPRVVDQVHLEVLELQKQVAELQKPLGTARPEGGEPSHRKSLQKEGLTDGTPVGTEDHDHFSRHRQWGTQRPQPSSVPHLQRKLKEASRKILSLHLQREQLIEMGNRLRAELGRPGGRPPGHSQLPSPETQDPEDTPTEPRGPLGRLQPHPEAQDLELPVTEWVPGQGRRSQPHSAPPAGKNPAPRGSKSGPLVGPTQRQHRTPAVTCRATHQKENRAPEPPRANAAPEENGHKSLAPSSLASPSLQDTWRLLDLGSSPSGLPSQDECTAESPAPRAARCHQEADRSPVRMRFQETLAIEGMKMAAQSRARPSSSFSSRPARPKSFQPPSWTRNYNVKD
ncbi:coiled-coil domain-containing protein 57 [Fukomys damarensis]|uniref:coiled-coil domain-containing protein 57 n=1 Tax=Fukomys damarensis TaxID=885580 RepID=UPI00053F8C32|nr:coiled-coil domain-containing protein 57 [Fukomys damarensis]